MSTWVGTTTDPSVAANWDPASVPDVNDAVFFTAASDGQPCTFSAPMEFASLTTYAGYRSKIDLGAHALTVAGNITLDNGGEFDCGSSAISCGGSLDNKDCTWTKGTAAFTLTGTGKTLTGHSTNDFYDLTFAAGSSYTLHADTANRVEIDNLLTINGTLSLDDILSCTANANCVIGADAVITSVGAADELRFASSASTYGLTTFSPASIGCNVRFITPQTGSVFVSFSTTGNVLVIASAATAAVLELAAAGAYSFGSLELQSSHDSGPVTIDNSANDPASITITGNLTIDLDNAANITINDTGSAVNWNLGGNLVDERIGGGVFAWTRTTATGTVSLTGTGAQAIDALSLAMPDLLINKPTSGDVTITNAGIDTNTRLVLLDGLDMGGDLTLTSGFMDAEASGTFDIDGDLTVDLSVWDQGDSTIWTVGGNWDWKDVTTYYKGAALTKMTGTSKTITNKNNTAISRFETTAGSTIAIDAAGGSAFRVGVACNIAGTFTIPNGHYLYLVGCGTTVSGTITGVGTGWIRFYDAGGGLHSYTGTINCPIEIYRPDVLTEFAGGSFGSSLKVVCNSTGAYVLALTGDHTFAGTLEVENTNATGSITIQPSIRLVPTPTTPVLSDARTEFASFCKYGGQYHAFGGTPTADLYHWTSADGVTWANPTALTGVPGDSVCTVWREDSEWKMIYRGDNTGRGIRLATSTDEDGNTWTDYASNPLFQGTAEAWDGGDGVNTTLDPWGVIKVDGTYYCWYNLVTTTPRKVGLATAPALTGPWTKHASNPIFDLGFCVFPFVYGGKHYLVNCHPTSGTSYAELELWQDTVPTFLDGVRVLMGTWKSCAPRDALYGDWYNHDTPFIITDDIGRDTFTDTDNELWVYYSGQRYGTEPDNQIYRAKVAATGTLTATDFTFDRDLAGDITIDDTVGAMQHQQNWVCSGNFVDEDLVGGGSTTWTSAVSTLTFSGTAAQAVDAAFIAALPNVTINKTAETVTLGSKLTCASLDFQDGDLAFATFDLETTGDCTIANGCTVGGGATGMEGVVWTVGGDLHVRGTPSAALDLQDDAEWELAVTGNATAIRTTVTNCNASSSELEVHGGTDGGGNTNVTFYGWPLNMNNSSYIELGMI